MNVTACCHTQNRRDTATQKPTNQNYNELTWDMDALKLEDPTCNNWDKYICRKPGSQLPAFYRQLHDAQDSNLKRSLKHTDLSTNDEIPTKGEKSASSTFVTPERERSQTFQPRGQVKPLNLRMRPKSETETFPNVPTIPLAKPIGHGNARAARHLEMLPESSKQDQKQHPLDPSTALIIQGYRRTR